MRRGLCCSTSLWSESINRFTSRRLLYFLMICWSDFFIVSLVIVRFACRRRLSPPRLSFYSYLWQLRLILWCYINGRHATDGLLFNYCRVGEFRPRITDIDSVLLHALRVTTTYSYSHKSLCFYFITGRVVF